jgi:hypothetical protein
MGRKKKDNWEEDAAIGQAKTEAQALDAPQVVVKTETTKVKTEDTVEQPTRIPHKEIDNPTKQNVSAGDKGKLPQVILTYQDKNHRTVTKIYTCYELNIHENTETVLTGIPTSRKDIVDLSLDAKIVLIE